MRRVFNSPEHDLSQLVIDPNIRLLEEEMLVGWLAFPLSWVSRFRNSWIYVHGYVTNQNCFGHQGATKITDVLSCLIFLRTQGKRDIGGKANINGSHHWTRDVFPSEIVTTSCLGTVGWAFHVLLGHEKSHNGNPYCQKMCHATKSHSSH